MRSHEKKNQIKLIVNYLKEKGFPIELDVNSFGGKIVEMKDGKEGRDISLRLKVNDLYWYCVGLHDAITCFPIRQKD